MYCDIVKLLVIQIKFLIRILVLSPFYGQISSVMLSKIDPKDFYGLAVRYFNILIWQTAVM